MRISIVIPLYNKEKSIRRAMYSALDQVDCVDQDIELIVVDDGSSDESMKQAIVVMNENPSRQIRILQQENRGVSAARNLGAAFAQNEYIAFLDADDCYAPTFIATIHGLHEAYPWSHFFATSYEFISIAKGVRHKPRMAHIDINKDRQKITDFFAVAADGDLPFCASSICISKTMFKTCGGFPEGENMGEDQDLYCKVALRQSIAFCPSSHAKYYVDVGGSLMQSAKNLDEMPFSKRLQHRLDQQRIPQRLQKSVKKYISGHLLDLARRNLVNGNKQAALSLLKNKRSKEKIIKWCFWRGKSLMV